MVPTRGEVDVHTYVQGSSVYDYTSWYSCPICSIWNHSTLSTINLAVIYFPLSCSDPLIKEGNIS